MCVFTRKKHHAQWHIELGLSWRGVEQSQRWWIRAQSGWTSGGSSMWYWRLPHFALTSGPRPALRTATGELLKHYGLRTVNFWCQSKELQLQRATAVCARRHNLTQRDCARIVCVVCVLFVFRSTSLSSKSDAPRGQTVLANFRCLTPLRRTEWALRLFPKQCGVCRRWRRDFL